MARGSGDPPTRWRGYGVTMVKGNGWGEVDKIMDDKIIGSKMMGTTNHTK